MVRDSPTASAEMNMLISDIGVLQQQIVKAKEDLVNLEVNRELQTRAVQSPCGDEGRYSAAELIKIPRMQELSSRNNTR